MMIPSARRLEKYILRLVASLDKNIQDAFDNDLVYFHIDPANGLTLMVADTVDEKQKAEIQLGVFKYLEAHPAPFIQETAIH